MTYLKSWSEHDTTACKDEALLWRKLHSTFHSCLSTNKTNNTETEISTIAYFEFYFTNLRAMNVF